jgi:DNA-directed RNA polymerase specialized sigma24 family protein
MCRAQARNGLDTEELYQRVMIRAWRGHGGFRGNSAYLTWVRQIIVREAARMAAVREAELRRRVAVDPARAVEITAVADAGRVAGGRPDDTAAPWIAGPGSAAGPGDLAGVLDQAIRVSAVSPGEHAVLTARLRHPDHTWEQLGAMLGVTATACAVTHCRAVPKLRVFLFLHRPDVLGGPDEIAAAFNRASRRLTAAEAEAFTFLVLHDRAGYRRRGWQTALRGACATVAEELASG